MLIDEFNFAIISKLPVVRMEAGWAKICWLRVANGSSQKALKDYAFRNGSGSLEVRCNPPRLICANDVPMPDLRRARLVPIGQGSAD